MVKKLVAVLVFALVAAVPLRADVKYMIHMEARPAANASGDPMSQMMAGMLGQIFPPGGIDQTVTQGDKGMRSEQKQAFANIKAGTVTLVRPDGSMLMMDPSTKTYWKQPAVAESLTAGLGGATPEVKILKRGEFETIAGMKAEHLQMQMTLQIPGVDPAMAAQLGDLTMRFDVWLTDAIKTPAAAGSLSATVMKQFGLGNLKELSDGRMMLKSVMTMFGVEIVTTSTGFTNEPAPASLFEPPADYKEVPSPIR